MKHGLPYALVALALSALGVWLDSGWLAIAGALGSAHAASLISRAVQESRRNGQTPK